MTLRYVTGGYEVTPVRDLSFEADDGELVLLLGASGCGKTTLLSALASLLAPAAGSIKLDDI
ncbi:MAG TPA: ATP-binding cassette domain-containing protein, partial [Ilumatobacteraceae bacterium]|nr:ATP-binding cassette domain-containing protein [Ilumatobacteraceae bacterium]